MRQRKCFIISSNFRLKKEMFFELLCGIMLVRFKASNITPNFSKYSHILLM